MSGALGVREFTHACQARVRCGLRGDARHAPDGQQHFQTRRRCAFTHLGVRAVGLRAQFRHVAEHRELAARAREILQRLQAREHRVRIRVVRIVEHADAARFPQLQPHAGRGASRQARLQLTAHKSQLCAHGEREQGVDDLMAAMQAKLVAPRKFRARGRDREGHAVLVAAHVRRAPVVAGVKANFHHAGRGARDDRRDVRIVAVEEEAAVRGQQLGQPAFLRHDAGHVAKKFQMLAPDARDDAEARLDHPHQRREFAGMIGPDLEHRRPV